MSSSAETLLKSIANGEQLPRCFCVLGPDLVRRERATDYVINSIFKDEASKPEIYKYSLRSLKDDDFRIIEEKALSPSLFSSRSILILTSVESVSASNGKKILSLIQDSMSADFILSGEKIAKNTTFYKTLAKDFQIAQFAPLKGRTLSTWIQKELKRNEISEVSNATADIIGQIGESNLDLIAGMCSQLGLYSDDGKLTPKDIYQLFHQAADPNEFGLPEAIVSSKPGDLEILIEELLQTGKNAFILVSRLFWTYAALGKISGLQQQGFNSKEIGSELGLTDWIFKKYLNVAKHYKPERLPGCMDSIARADSKLKNKSAGEAAILSELCAELSP